MAHRTLNAEKAFYGDGRETHGQYSTYGGLLRRSKVSKYDVEKAWEQEFPGAPLPQYPKGTPIVFCPYHREIWPRLQAAGWKFSSRYGWRKKEQP